MSKDLRRQLIACYISVILVAFVTGIIGQVAHKLDLVSTIELCFFAVAFPSTWAWYSIREERNTNKRILGIQFDLEPLSMRVLKGKSGVYAVATGEALSSIIVTEDLSLEELEAWTQGLFFGLDIAYEEEPIANHEDIEDRQARQAAQHEEDKNYYSQWGLHEDEP